MKKIIKNEMVKMFSNRQIYFSIGIGIVLTIVLTFLQVRDREVYEKMLLDYGSMGELFYPNTVYNSFIGLDYFYLPSVIFYTILPILATLPFSASYFSEKKSGYIKNILVKVSKRKYYFSKFIAVFFSAFITVLIMSLISLIITMMFFPVLKPELVTATYTISNENLMWFDLFVTYPMLYILAYILLDAFFYGAITLMTLVISMITHNKFIVYTGTMILCMSVDYLAKIINIPALSPAIFLRPIQSVEGINFFNIAIGFIGIIIVSGILFLKVEERKDVI